MNNPIPNDRHLDAEAERNEQWQEQRAARIESAAKELMQSGGECDPYGVTVIKDRNGKKYTYNNLFEAFNELPELEQMTISDMWRAATLIPDNAGTWPQETIFDRMDALVRAYWMKQAMAIAERNDK